MQVSRASAVVAAVILIVGAIAVHHLATTADVQPAALDPAVAPLADDVTDSVIVVSGYDQVEEEAEGDSMRFFPQRDFPTTPSSGVEVPSTITPAVEATPVPTTKDDSIRSLIRRHLSSASADEQEVWFEELRELPTEMAEEILKLRKNLGTPRFNPPPLSDHDPVVPIPETRPESTVVAPMPSDTRFILRQLNSSASAIEAALAVRVHNVANASSVGFKRCVPLLTESDAAVSVRPADGRERESVRFHGSRVDSSAGPHRETEGQLDLAIQGPGFFRVMTPEGERLTRRGQFERDVSGALKVRGIDAVLIPRIVIPQETEEIRIRPGGDIAVQVRGSDDFRDIGVMTVFNAIDVDLQPAGQSLYVRPTESELTAEGSSIRQGWLEDSNVEIEAEQAAVDRLLKQWKALGAIRQEILGGPIVRGPGGPSIVK